MSLSDWLLLGAIACAVLAALRFLRRKPGGCGCCSGDCSKCTSCGKK